MSERSKWFAGRRWLWVALPALVALAVLERVALPALRGARQPTGPARWIWAPDLDTEDGSVAFFAIKDFEIPADALTAAGEAASAQLRIAADEAFRVSLNGETVASGGFQPDRSPYRFQVGRYLRPGANRMLVELRSGRGVGGLLLALDIESRPELRVVSDRSWRIVREYRSDLPRPGTVPPGAVAAREWGTPPTGRWGHPDDGPELPLRADLLLPGDPVTPRRGRAGDPAGRWIPLPRATPDPAGLGLWVTFDFGRERTGFLELLFSGGEPVTGLVFTGNKLPDPRLDRPQTVMIKAAGFDRWKDVYPRSFRYVTVVALKRVAGAEVLPVDIARSSALKPGSKPAPRVFGVRAPALRPAAEHRFWRELERITSL